MRAIARPLRRKPSTPLRRCLPEDILTILTCACHHNARAMLTLSVPFLLSLDSTRLGEVCYSVSMCAPREMAVPTKPLCVVPNSSDDLCGEPPEMNMIPMTIGTTMKSNLNAAPANQAKRAYARGCRGLKTLGCPSSARGNRTHFPTRQAHGQ